MKNKFLSILFAYFALVNSEGVVENVIRDDLRLVTKTAPAGKAWVETFKDGRNKKRFAGKGYVLDKKLDAFIYPKLFPSWVLNEKDAKWEPPVPKPANCKKCYWDEETRSHKEAVKEEKIKLGNQ